MAYKPIHGFSLDASASELRHHPHVANHPELQASPPDPSGSDVGVRAPERLPDDVLGPDLVGDQAAGDPHQREPLPKGALLVRYHVAQRVRDRFAAHPERAQEIHGVV